MTRARTGLRMEADTDPNARDTRELEGAVADKPRLIRKIVLGVLPGLILTCLSGIVAAVVAFAAMQGKVGAQDMRVDRIEEARREDREQIATLTRATAQIAETQAKVVTRLDAADATRAQFWEVHWPALMSRLDRTDSKIDGLIEAVSRRPR
jgi:hypothetical protein